MIVYKCIITECELFTDTLPQEVIEDCLYKIKCKHVTRKIGEISDSMIGGNPSAEEAPEETSDDQTESGLNIVLNHGFNHCGEIATSKQLMEMLKPIVKKFLKKRLEMEPSRPQEEIENSVKAAVAHLKPKLKGADIYRCYSEDDESTLGICIYETQEGSDDQIPYFYFFKEHVKEEKY